MDFDFGSFEPDNLILQPIYRALQQQKCILVLGPNLATVSPSDKPIPILDYFAFVLSNHLKKSKIAFDPDEVYNLKYIALRWLREMKGVRDIDLRGGLKKLYTQNSKQVPEFYQKLAKLPFSLVVNTGHDSYIAQAFEQAGKKVQFHYYNYQRNKKDGIETVANSANPLIYNLFGYYEEEESMVITKENQLDFIQGLQNVSILPNGLLMHFDEEKTYLFLGFDPETWHLPLLLRSLRLGKDSSTFYLDPQESTDDILIDFYQDLFNCHFVNNSPQKFVDELTEGFTKWEQEHKIETKDKADYSIKYVEEPREGLEGNAMVLMLTSNPKDAETLELEKEINIVEEALVEGSQRDTFEVKPVLNINKKRLLPVLLRHRPQVVHFSGHGVGEGGLLFYDEDGYADTVGGEELALLFEQFEGTISCVVLNACYSMEQAKIIAQHIPNVIGTDNAIGDEVALSFAEGFYTALFAGETYEKSYNMAMAHVGLEKFPAGGRPVFYKNGKQLAE